ncbi:MAG TPA: lipopolysaccharide kinase InaA family protein, partial [Humisphaera sp.]
NPKAEEVFRSQVARAKRGGRYFHDVATGGWRGLVFRQTNFPRRWSAVSQLELSAADVDALLQPIFAGLKDKSLAPLKQSPSADVYELTVKLAGRDVPVVVKVPHRRYVYRHVTELGRGGRAWRAWVKAWHLVARDLPTAWPIAVLERGVPGYATASLIVCERVPGPTLWKVDLDALTARGRDMLFHRTGRILRLLERHGFSHFDAKASNWIVRPDERLGPGPVLIDVDGIRRRRWPALGVERLLRSLLDRRQYGPADSLALCRGYAPFARLEQEEPTTDHTEGTEEEEEEDHRRDAEGAEGQTAKRATNGTNDHE